MLSVKILFIFLSTSVRCRVAGSGLKSAVCPCDCVSSACKLVTIGNQKLRALQTGQENMRQVRDKLQDFHGKLEPFVNELEKVNIEEDVKNLTSKISALRDENVSLKEQLEAEKKLRISIQNLIHATESRLNQIELRFEKVKAAVEKDLKKSVEVEEELSGKMVRLVEKLNVLNEEISKDLHDKFSDVERSIQKISATQRDFSQMFRNTGEHVQNTVGRLPKDSNSSTGSRSSKMIAIQREPELTNAHQGKPAADSRICSLPKVSRPCIGHPPEWYYDGFQNECVKYALDDCPANDNRFDSVKKCRMKCKTIP